MNLGKHPNWSPPPPSRSVRSTCSGDRGVSQQLPVLFEWNPQPPGSALPFHFYPLSRRPQGTVAFEKTLRRPWSPFRGIGGSRAPCTWHALPLGFGSGLRFPSRSLLGRCGPFLLRGVVFSPLLPKPPCPWCAAALYTQLDRGHNPLLPTTEVKTEMSLPGGL